MSVYILILIVIMAGIVGHDLRYAGSSNARPAGVDNSLNGVSGAWRVWFWLAVALMAIVAGLRYHCGVDSWTFLRTWDVEVLPFTQYLREWRDYTLAERDLLFMAAVKSSGGAPWILQLLCALFLNYMIGRFALRESGCRPFMVLLLYYLTFYIHLNFEVMRQGVAVGCFLWAWPDFRNKRYWAYLLKVALGIFAHGSAAVLLFLPLFWIPGALRRFSSGKGICVACGIAIAMGWMISRALPTIILDHLRSMDDSPLAGYLARRISQYGPKLLSTGLNLRGYLRMDLLFVIVPLWIGLMIRRKERSTGGYEAASMLLLIGCLGLSSNFLIQLWRLAGYFIPFLWTSAVRLYPAPTRASKAYTPECKAYTPECKAPTLECKAFTGAAPGGALESLENHAKGACPRGGWRIRWRRLGWWVLAIGYCGLYLYPYFKTPAGEEAPTYVIYYPWTNWIDCKPDARQDSVMQRRMNLIESESEDWKHFGR